jgi:hypothetical protein
LFSDAQLDIRSHSELLPCSMGISTGNGPGLLGSRGALFVGAIMWDGMTGRA